jgi:hypothetical protein
MIMVVAVIRVSRFMMASELLQDMEEEKAADESNRCRRNIEEPGLSCMEDLWQEVKCNEAEEKTS